MYWLLRLALDTLLPRHRTAVRARAVSTEVLAELMRPSTMQSAHWIHVLWPYRDERVRAVIKAIKYYGESELAGRVGALAADYLLELVGEKRSMGGWDTPVVVPIPSSTRRLRERGYNQAARIAEAVMQHMDGADYNPALLKREERESQVHVARTKRKDNIAGAFITNPAAAGAFVILIDDVVESGATLQDARRALLAAGAQDVIALVMAH